MALPLRAPRPFDYGKGVHVVQETEMPVGASEIRDAVRAALADPGWRAPTLPHVALEMMALTRRAAVSFAELSHLLEKDPSLAARVMQIAQSAVYAGAIPTRTLQQAATRLGLQTLRDAVWEAAMRGRVFRSQRFEAPMELVRRHSVLSGHVARVVCRRTSSDAEHAFLVGLLHDIGVAVALTVIADAPSLRGRVEPAALWSEVHVLHEEVGAVVAAHWKLPPEIALVIAHHHRVVIDGHPHPYVAMLTIVEEVVHAVGGGLSTISPGLDGALPSECRTARAVLGLDDAAVEEIRVEAERLASLVFV